MIYLALNQDGFTRKTYSDLVDEMEEKFKELFGADINLASYTPLGIIMRVMAFFYAMIWDAIEKVYNSRFIKKSDGVSLDYHGSDKRVLRNPASNAYVTLKFVGTPNYIIQAETIARTEGDVQFATLEDVTIGLDGTATVQAISVETGGYNNVLPQTITYLLEADENITSVTNEMKADGGADIESDASYQSRLLRINESNGKATMTAVETALNNVVGVRSANIVTNRTMEVDAQGNPPKSLHAYVLGGAKEDIAQALFDAMSATSQTVGAQEVTIADNSKNQHIVRFDYATEKMVYVKLTISKTAAFEADGELQLKNAIIEYIGGIDSNGDEQGGLSMGGTVVMAKLFGIAYKVNGIEDIDIQIGLSASALQRTNIDISQNEVATTSLTNIEVIYNA